MGCTSIVCGKQSYNYALQEKVLLNILPEFSNLAKCYSHEFVIKCHKNLLASPEAFILKYEQKIEEKQNLPDTILQKWKLILYGTNIENKHYIDCLGFDKQVQEERISSKKTYRFSRQNPFQIRIQDLYFHETYKQIEKDAGRVFLVPQIKQELFQKVLKKIANHFPQSGYSLGINYIVAYFLLIGMSEIHSFWMFIHLALNEKFLALGFYENSLPLAKVIIQVFKNILKRKNKDLYQHIYKHMQINDESWILKWIISFYLSAFPIQFCHYVWNYILEFGIVGMATVAFTLVNQLQKILFKCEDQADFNITLKEVLNVKTFLKQIRIEEFMNQVYCLKIEYNDFRNLNANETSFYSDYFTLYAEWRYRQKVQSRQKLDELVSDWYQSIINNRQSFTKQAKSSGKNFFIPNKIQQIEKQSDSQKEQILQNQKIQRRTDQDQKYNDKNNQNTMKQDVMQKTSNSEVKKEQKQQKQQKSPLQMHQNTVNNIFYPSPQTIKGLSRRHLSEQNVDQSKQYEEQQGSNFSIFSNPRSYQQLSQVVFTKHLKNIRKIKSDSQVCFKRQKQEYSIEQQQVCSIQMLNSHKNLSEDNVQFNQKTVNKQFFLELIKLNRTSILVQRSNCKMMTFGDHFFSGTSQKGKSQGSNSSESQRKQEKHQKNTLELTGNVAGQLNKQIIRHQQVFKIQRLAQNYHLNELLDQNGQNCKKEHSCLKNSLQKQPPKD